MLDKIEELVDNGDIFHSQMVDDVRLFNREKLPFLTIPAVPTMPSKEDQVYLLASLLSEVAELGKAFATNDMVEMVDGLLDSIYVQLGILYKCGIPIEACWEEIQRSNMAKYPAVPGTMGRRTAPGQGGGPNKDSMKPDGWVGPRIKEILDHVTQRDTLLGATN